MLGVVSEFVGHALVVFLTEVSSTAATYIVTDRMRCDIGRIDCMCHTGLTVSRLGVLLVFLELVCLVLLIVYLVYRETLREHFNGC